MLDADHAPTLQRMFYTSNVRTGRRDINGGRVLFEHLSGCVHSPNANGKGKAVTYFQTLSHGWAEEKKLILIHIQPGRPMPNGYVESFHGRLRDECLNAHWFRTLHDVRATLENWRQEYNCVRPHSGLDYRTPEEFRRTLDRGKDGGVAALETLHVYHFPTIPTAAAS
jgi:Integrase core domain